MIRIIVDKIKMPMLHEYLSFVILTAKNIRDLILTIKYNDGQSQLGYLRYELGKYESYQWENHYDMNRYNGNNWNIVVANDIISKLFYYVEGPIGMPTNVIDKIRLENNSLEKVEERLMNLKSVHVYNPYAIGTINECTEIFLLEGDLKRFEKRIQKKATTEKKKKEISLNWEKKYNNIKEIANRIKHIKNELVNHKAVIKAGLPLGVSYAPIANLIKNLEAELVWLEKEILNFSKNRTRKPAKHATNES